MSLGMGWGAACGDLEVSLWLVNSGEQTLSL